MTLKADGSPVGGFRVPLPGSVRLALVQVVKARQEPFG